MRKRAALSFSKPEKKESEREGRGGGKGGRGDRGEGGEGEGGGPIVTSRRDRDKYVRCLPHRRVIDYSASYKYFIPVELLRAPRCDS